MLSLKAYLIFVVAFCFEAMVYLDKLKIFTNVYTQNCIKIFFAYSLLTLLFYFLAVFAYASKDTKNVTDEQTLKAYKNFKTISFKILQIISFVISIGYGVIGCWWFFSVALSKEILSLVFMKQVNEAAEKILEKIPELKKQYEKKVKVKTKFNFLTER